LTCLEAPVVAPIAITVPSARTSHQMLRLAGLASITVSFLAASSAPTPLYATYQAAWRFSAFTTTAIFGVYAVALLATLLTAGRLSDHIGRRPVLLAGIGVQIAALVVLADAHSVAALMTGRVIQGLATGAAIGAVGAAMLDIDQVRGAVANATAPGLGTASGSLLSAVAVQWLPAPTHLIYLTLIAVLAIQAVWVTSITETSSRAPRAWSSLRPKLALPPKARGPFLAAAPVMFAVWGLAGFYGSLGPSLLADLAHSRSAIDGGLPLGILAGIAALTTYALRSTPPPRVMRVGTAALIAGVAVTLVAVRAGSPAGFYVGTAVAGIGFGAGFQGGIRLIAPLAAPDQRAGVVSVLFTVSYLGMGLPAVLAGAAVASGGGLVATTYHFGLAVIALAALATVNLTRLHQPTKETAR
jgi:MFS family permease